MFSVLFLNFVNIDWSLYPNMNHVIQACARAAVARGYRLFSVQFYTQCRWGPSASGEIKKLRRSRGCYSGMGSWGTGFVYRVQDSSGAGELTTSFSFPGPELASYCTHN